ARAWEPREGIRGQRIRRKRRGELPVVRKEKEREAVAVEALGGFLGLEWRGDNEPGDQKAEWEWEMGMGARYRLSPIPISHSHSAVDVYGSPPSSTVFNAS